MNRRNKNIIAGAAGVALVLGIGGTVLAMNKDVEPEVSPVAASAEVQATVTTEQALWGTSMQLPDHYTAFFIGSGFEVISDGVRSPVADLDLDAEESTFPYTADQIAQIEQQLIDAPPQSILFVDDRSIGEAGLTTALATLTPSNGLTLGDSNESITVFMQGQFANKEGAYSNLQIEAVPNASFSFTETVDGVEWDVTEHLLQYGDAMMSVRFTTEGVHADEFNGEFLSFLTTWTRG